MSFKFRINLAAFLKNAFPTYIKALFASSNTNFNHNKIIKKKHIKYLYDKWNNKQSKPIPNFLKIKIDRNETEWSSQDLNKDCNLITVKHVLVGS